MTVTSHHAGLDDVVGDANRLLKVRLTNFAIDAFLIAFGLAMLLPLVFLVANAFKTPQEILLWPPTIVPHDPTLENFKAVLSETPLLIWIWNSLLFACLSTASITTTSAIAGYILGKFSSKVLTVVFATILATAIIPFEVYMIPLYFQVKALGALNSVWGLMVGYLVMSFGIFLIRQNVIHSIPDELLEAARIDGAGESGVLLYRAAAVAGAAGSAWRAGIFPGLDRLYLAADCLFEQDVLHHRGRACVVSERIYRGCRPTECCVSRRADPQRHAVRVPAPPLRAGRCQHGPEGVSMNDSLIKKPKQRVALIGLGMAVTPHARALRDLSDRVEVAYAYSQTPGRREAFGRDFDFPLTDRFETILEDRSVDAVLILTPANTHLDLVRRCAAAGKHILLEKPVEITTARAEALVAATRASGVRLGIVLQNRYRPACLALKKVIDEGRLGRLVGVSAVTNNWRPQSYYDELGRGTRARDGGGVLLTQAIHTLDLMISFAGAPQQVTGFATTSPVHRMETEDIAVAAIRYANGAVGTVSATTCAYPGLPERIEMIGDAGVAVLDGTVLKVAFHSGEALEAGDATASGGGTGADPMAFPHAYHQALISEFSMPSETAVIPGSLARRRSRCITSSTRCWPRTADRWRYRVPRQMSADPIEKIS